MFIPSLTHTQGGFDRRRQRCRRLSHQVNFWKLQSSNYQQKSSWLKSHSFYHYIVPKYLLHFLNWNNNDAVSWFIAVFFQFLASLYYIYVLHSRKKLNLRSLFQILRYPDFEFIIDKPINSTKNVVTTKMMFFFNTCMCVMLKFYHYFK